MTTRQAHEAARLQHRFGHVRTRKDRDLLVVDIIGDPPIDVGETGDLESVAVPLPKVTVKLDSAGHPVDAIRHETPEAISAIESTIMDELAARQWDAWSPAEIADIAGVQTRHARAALERLAAFGLVDAHMRGDGGVRYRSRPL